MSTEYFKHDECVHCAGASTPAEGIPDQTLRLCINCSEVWFEDLEQPVRSSQRNDMLKYKLGERIPIFVNRNEPNFDRACDVAYDMALMYTGCDSDEGEFLNVEVFNPDECSLIIEFVGYRHTGTVGGQWLEYEFSARVEGVETDDEFE